jgi:ABC-type transporter Mla MlaB component
MSFARRGGLYGDCEKRSLSLAAPEPRTIVLVIGGPIARADIPGLCDRACALLEGGGAEFLLCDVSALVRADAATVDALGRLQLTARRFGAQVLLHRTSPGLRELLAFVGLSAVLARSPALRVQPHGQPEQREQALGVQEERELDDPAV